MTMSDLRSVAADEIGTTIMQTIEQSFGRHLDESSARHIGEVASRGRSAADSRRGQSTASGSRPRRHSTRSRAEDHDRRLQNDDSSRRWTNGAGDEIESSTWHHVVYWGSRQAGSLQGIFPYLINGKTVGVRGELHLNEWDQDGERRYRTEIHTRDVTLLSGTKPDPSELD